MNKLKKGDIVQIISGKDKGKRGEILGFVNSKLADTLFKNKVLVKGINIVKRAKKANPQLGIAGGIVESEKAIDISNVQIVDPKLDVPTKVGIKVDSTTGKKVRFAKKSGEIIN